MRVMKTILASTLAVATLATSQAALADTELKLWTWREQEIALWEYVTENNLVPGVDIIMERISSDDYEAKLRIGLQQGGPDLFQGKAGAAWLEPLIKAGAVAPLKGVSLKNIVPSTLSAATGPDGKIYGVPFAVQMESIIYNTAVFDKYGLSEPANEAEFVALMKTLKSNGVVPLHHAARAGWWNNQVLNETLLAGLVSDKFAQKLESGKACFTDKEFVNAIETFDSWSDYFNPNPTADDYGAMRTSVALGDSAMMIDGAWSTGPASPMYDIEPDLELGFFAVPGKNGKVYAFADGAYLGNAASEKQDAIKKVMQFTTTEQFSQLFVDKVGELPAYSGSLTLSEPRLQEIAGLIAENSLEATPFFAYNLNSGQPSYGTLLATGYQELLSGKTDAAGLAANIQKGLNSWGYVGANKCK